MRHFLLLSLLVISCANAVHEQTKTDSVAATPPPPAGSCSPECGADSGLCPFYYFKNNFYDLNTLQELVTNVFPRTHFKLCSKYRDRFYRNDNPFTGHERPDTVHWNGAVFSVNDKQQLVIRNRGSVKTISVFKGERGNANVWPGSLLKATPTGVVVLIDDQEQHFHLAKFDAGGKELFNTEVEHTEIQFFDNTYHSYPYLVHLGSTPKQWVFTSNTQKQVTVVVDLDSGKKTEYDFIAGGIVADENEERIAGFIRDRDSLMEIRLLQPAKQFTVKKQSWYESANTVLCGNRLVIACFPRIATGSQLLCVDIANEKLLWNADVLQVNASHSEYYNSVTLSLYNDKVIMEGNEANGDYLQFFDLNSGKRLAAFGVSP